MAVRSQNFMVLHESLARHDECGRLVVRDAKSSRTSLAVRNLRFVRLRTVHDPV